MNKYMKKSMILLEEKFVSSSIRTPQYLKFHRTFKRELRRLLDVHTKEIDIGKPNHFDISGFFKMNDDRIYYFSLGDLRWNKANILISTAKDFRDFTPEERDNINFAGEVR